MIHAVFTVLIFNFKNPETNPSLSGLAILFSVGGIPLHVARLRSGKFLRKFKKAKRNGFRLFGAQSIKRYPLSMRLWKDAQLQISLTRLGLHYFCAMLLLGILAVNSGNNLLYLSFSAMVALFVLSGWISRKALRDLTFEKLEAKSVFARMKSHIRLHLQDHAPRRMRGLEIRLIPEDPNARIEVLYFRGATRKSEACLAVPLHASQRGDLSIQAMEIQTSFPFGFLLKSRRFTLNERVEVFPHPKSPLQNLTNSSENKVQIKKGLLEPEGSRPFRKGDPVNRMHWKRSAQRGELYIRTFSGEESQGVELELDLKQWAPGQAFEGHLEQLSGAILQARIHKKNVTLELKNSEGLRKYQGYSHCWQVLARAQAEKTDITPPQKASLYII